MKNVRSSQAAIPVPNRVKQFFPVKIVNDSKAKFGRLIQGWAYTRWTYSGLIFFTEVDQGMERKI